MGIGGIGANTGIKAKQLIPVQADNGEIVYIPTQQTAQIASLIPTQEVSVKNDYFAAAIAYPSWVNKVITWGTGLGLATLTGLWFIGREVNRKRLAKYSNSFQESLKSHWEKLKAYDEARKARLKEGNLDSIDRKRLKGDKLLTEDKFTSSLRFRKFNNSKPQEEYTVAMAYPLPAEQCLELVGMQSLMESKGEPLSGTDRKKLNEKAKKLFSETTPIDGWFNAKGEFSGLARNNPSIHIKTGARKVWSWLTGSTKSSANRTKAA